SLIADRDRLTTTKTRIVAHSQQMMRVDREQRSHLATPIEDALLAALEQHVPRVDACILSDYAKGVVSPGFSERFIRLADRHGKKIIVDPKGTNFAKYRGCTLLKPNLHEAERFLRREIVDDATLREAGVHMVEALGGSTVLITRGAAGMSLFESGRE